MTSPFQKELISLLPQLRPYALTMTRSNAGADDLIQQTALRALRAQEQFEMGTNMKAWLYRIMRNEHISSLRRRKFEGPSLADVAENVLTHKANQEDRALTMELFKAMDRLPKAQREVLMMNVGGLAYEEIAEALGCSLGTVKSRLFRARASMEQFMLGDPVEEKKAVERMRERRVQEERDRIAVC